MKDLDFLIIGAQKCATTTLFEHLRQHPRVHMPLEKEVPFFTDPECDAAAWARFSDQHFGAPDGRLRGKATPQYMCDPDAAQRIHRLMPGVKLVAILRDPVERTFSHYQMGQRRATEARPFDDAVAELLAPGALQRSRCLPVPAHASGYEPESAFYVAWSEYGRVLQSYTELFGPQQLLVLYTEDLQRDPGATLDRLLAFIGLDPGFRPGSLGEVMHQGGSGNRIPHGVRVWLRQQRALYAVWKWLPDDQQGRLRFLYERWNVRRSRPGGAPMSEFTRARLRQHFSRDLALLDGLSCDQPPWLGGYRGG